MLAPNTQLAANILDRLIQEGVLTQAQAEKIKAGLESGKLKPEDWHSAIELSVKKGDADGQ